MLNQETEPIHEMGIALTLVGGEAGNPSVKVQIQPKQMITYRQQLGFTQLRLTGHKVLEVEESTDQIDQLIRGAATNPFSRYNSGQVSIS
jgi:hypothetical protein